MTRALSALGFLLVLSLPAVAQVERPRSFPELRGTWLLQGTPTPDTSRQLTIVTTDTDLTVEKDAQLSERYPFNGSEVVQRDPRTGAVLDKRFRLTLVADAVALTARTISPLAQVGRPLDNRAIAVVTDAYRVEGDVLTIERNWSRVLEPAGIIVTPESSVGRHTLVYRRQVVAAR